MKNQFLGEMNHVINHLVFSSLVLPALPSCALLSLRCLTGSAMGVKNESGRKEAYTIGPHRQRCHRHHAIEVPQADKLVAREASCLAYHAYLVFNLLHFNSNVPATMTKQLLCVPDIDEFAPNPTTWHMFKTLLLPFCWCRQHQHVDILGIVYE